MNIGEQKKTTEKKKWIIGRLRKGRLPKQLIEEVMEKYDLKVDQAEKLVYDCNKNLKESLKEMYDDAAGYISNNVQAIAEDALDAKDRKAAIEAYKLLAKVLKVGSEDGKQEVTVNFGFSFDDKNDTDS